MRELISKILTLWFLFLSVGAGEGDDTAQEATDDGDDMFGGEDDEGSEDESTDTDTDSDSDDDSDDDDSEEDEGDDDDDEEEDEDDEEDAESDDDDADESGEGGEGGVDPAALSLTRNWESRLEGMKANAQSDPLAVLKNTDVEISDATRERVRKLFEEEKDIEAIVTVLQDVAPALLTAYDESRIAPMLDAVQITSRNQRLTAAVDAFDKRYPGARTPEINERMAQKYNEFKDKYGYQYADAVPPEDYFIMVGGRLPSKPAGKKKTKKGKSRRERVEEEKRRSLSTTREPGRVATPKSPKGRRGKKRSEDDEVDSTYEAVRSTRFDPFTMN